MNRGKKGNMELNIKGLPTSIAEQTDEHRLKWINRRLSQLDEDACILEDEMRRLYIEMNAIKERMELNRRFEK